VLFKPKELDLVCAMRINVIIIIIIAIPFPSEDISLLQGHLVRRGVGGKELTRSKALPKVS